MINPAHHGDERGIHQDFCPVEECIRIHEFRAYPIVLI
jgi:hypothetical protein